MRRIASTVLALALLAAAVAVGFALGGGTESVPSTETVAVDTAPVVRTDLIQRETLSGTLGFGEVDVLRAAISGTVTALPEEAQRIERGGVAFEVDGRPVVVLVGERPAWRALGPDTEDGVDVLQLEENLVALGYGPVEWTPDEDFDGDTADAVESFREEYGLDEDDEVELGRVVFLPGPVRVGSLLVAKGDVVGSGTPMLEYSGFEQEVRIEVEPDRLDLVKPGAPVTVELPDGAVVDGSIAEIGRVVISSGPEPDAPGVVVVTVRLAEPVAGLDQAPVDVDLERERAAGVLAVPVRALIALSDGGYAVEIDGRLIGVEIGDFADGLVEVTGPIAEGDLVVIPR